jgi:hypothetical protein
MLAPTLPRNVVRLLSKVYRALYFADPVESDLMEYLTDDSALLDDIACYRIDLEHGRIEPEDLLDENDFAAVPALLAIRVSVIASTFSLVRTAEAELV